MKRKVVHAPSVFVDLKEHESEMLLSYMLIE